MIFETNNIADFPYKAVDLTSPSVSLDDPRLVSVDRIRLLGDSDSKILDVSYVWGTLNDGTHRSIYVNWGTRIHKNAVKASLIAIAKEMGVYAKGLGMLDSNVISILR